MKRPILAGASIALALLLSPAALLAADGNTKPDQPARVSFGQEVDINDYIVKGKTTIVDFTSKFCPPCERISPLLDKLHASREDMVVVKVDINRPDVRGIDWKSPVARQYELNSIPHFKVFGPDGKLQAEGEEAYAIVNNLVGS
ncbi:MAG TPA: thioredoxin family protein [Opitutaceae bacterium]|nr:thioredoxin family protein [Opitutaceae bacterium]